MMARRTAGQADAARGVALVAVLWIVAALSVLVIGVVQTQRDELRMASAARARLQAGAAGQAAIHLVVQGLLAAPNPPDRLVRLPVRYDDRDMVVEVLPLSGLVDINLAPAPLLARLFEVAGGRDAGQAGQLASAVIEARQARAAGPLMRFMAPEELLSVPGVDYDLYARLALLVTADSRGGGRINPLAAPQDVLQLLARGDRAIADRIAKDRDTGLAAIDTTRLETAFIDAATSSRFRFSAQVALPDGSVAVIARDIDISAASDNDTPWRLLRAHAPVLRPPQHNPPS